MKRFVGMLLMLCMCCGLLAGCGGKEESSEKDDNTKLMSSDFDSETNQKKTVKEYSYEVPEAWKENNSTDTISYFYPENGLLMVTCEEAEGVSIADEQFRKVYSQNVASGFEEFESLSSSELLVDNKTAYQEQAHFTASGVEFDGTIVTFDYDGGIIAFIMGTYASSDVSYADDFDKIIKSIKMINPENAVVKDTEEDEGSADDEIDKAAETNDTPEIKSSFDINKCIEDLKANLSLEPDYSFVQDYHIEVDESKEMITFTVVVDDATDPERALDFADTLVRQLNLYAQMQNSNITSASQYYYGGLYDKYSAMVGVAPASKVNSQSEWFVYDAIAKGGKTILDLQKKYK